MKKKPQRSHSIVINLRFDRAVSERQARYAAWNNLQDMQIFGSGQKDDSKEPFAHARIKVRK